MLIVHSHRMNDKITEVEINPICKYFQSFGSFDDSILLLSFHTYFFYLTRLKFESYGSYFFFFKLCLLCP